MTHASSRANHLDWCSWSFRRRKCRPVKNQYRKCVDNRLTFSSLPAWRHLQKLQGPQISPAVRLILNPSGFEALWHFRPVSSPLHVLNAVSLFSSCPTVYTHNTVFDSYLSVTANLSHCPTLPLVWLKGNLKMVVRPKHVASNLNKIVGEEDKMGGVCGTNGGEEECV
jgi:hypothetical protein